MIERKNISYKLRQIAYDMNGEMYKHIGGSVIDNHRVLYRFNIEYGPCQLIGRRIQRDFNRIVIQILSRRLSERDDHWRCVLHRTNIGGNNWVAHDRLYRMNAHIPIWRRRNVHDMQAEISLSLSSNEAVHQHVSDLIERTGGKNPFRSICRSNALTNGEPSQCAMIPCMR